MQGEEDKLRADARDAPEPGSEIPTDPSCPSHPSDSSGAGVPSGPPSASSSAARRAGRSTAASGARDGRPSTAIERNTRRRETAPGGERTDREAPLAPDVAEIRDEHVGKVFGGKYRIDKLVAKGGMGRVYRGMQFPLERPVAIKILNREFQRTDPQFVRRFFLEAATAAKLSHPHTITVFDYGEADNGELYIAMELLRGRPLSRVITNEGPFAAERALRIGIQVARAVREAHNLGIIHRDLKPGNIFLVDEGDEGDYAKVLDFGLVKLFRPDQEGGKNEPGMLGEGDPELTRTGTLLGSPKYMSPEQIQGLHLDPRTDIYSFGVILFQMISAKPPYTGATGVDVIYKHVHAPVPTIASVAPDVECPEVVEAIIAKCLSKRRDERYASMDELIGELKEVLRMLSGAALSADSVVEVDPGRSDALRSKIGDKRPSVRPGVERSGADRSPAERSGARDRPGEASGSRVRPGERSGARERPAERSDAREVRPRPPPDELNTPRLGGPAITGLPERTGSEGDEPAIEARSRPEDLREAALAEPSSSGTGEALGPDGSGALTARPSRMPLMLAASGFAIAVLTLVWVSFVGGRPTKTAAPGAQGAVASATGSATSPREGPSKPTELTITVGSRPPGAQVFDGTTLLGITPFAAKLPIATDGASSRELSFRHPGYKDGVQTVVLDGKTTTLEVTLVAEPAPKTEEPAAPAGGIERGEGDRQDSSESGATRRRRPPAKTKRDGTSPYRQNPY